MTSFTERPPGTPPAARDVLELVPAGPVAIFHGGARAQHNWIACIPKVPAVRGHYLFILFTVRRLGFCQQFFCFTQEVRGVGVLRSRPPRHGIPCDIA